MTSLVTIRLSPGRVGLGPADLSSRSAFGGDVDDRLSKGLRGFLWQVVPNTARDIPVRILARKFAGIGAGIRMRRAVGVTFKRNGGHGDDRAGGKATASVPVVVN